MTINPVNNQFLESLNIHTSTASRTLHLDTKNTDNSNAASNANLSITTGGASAGDPTVVFTNGVVSSCLGIDNSDSDMFKISLSAVPETTTVKYFSAGNLKRPYQPAFFGYRSSNVANITGTGTVYSIVFNNEYFDIASEYDTGTGIFTANQTGNYYFCTKASLTDSANCKTMKIDIVTTSYTYSYTYSRTNTSGLNIEGKIDVIAPMTAGDTAYVNIAGYGEGSDRDDLLGDASRTYFCGFLFT